MSNILASDHGSNPVRIRNAIAASESDGNSQIDRPDPATVAVARYIAAVVARLQRDDVRIGEVRQ